MSPTPTPTPADAKKHVDSAQASLNEMAESSTPPADAGPTATEQKFMLDIGAPDDIGNVLELRRFVASCLGEHALAAQPAVREFYERRLASLEAENQRLHKAGTDTWSELRTQIHALEADNERLRQVIREDIISARIIRAENAQRGRIHAIARDASFIEERCKSALSSPPPSPSAGAEKQE